MPAVKRTPDCIERIVATVREPLLVLDLEQRLQTASASFYRDFGVTPEQAQGRLLYELDSGAWNTAELRRLLQEVLPRESQFSDQALQHEFERIGRRTMLLNARLLQPADDLPGMILLAIEDITKRTEGQAAAAQLAAIVASSTDAIVSKDLDGVITSWNKGAQELFGYTAGEMIGKPVKLLIPDDHLDEEPWILEQIRHEAVVEHYETVRKRKDGGLLNISLTVSPIRDESGLIIGASKIARDITARKQAEEELRVAVAELAEVDRRKNEFLAALAHELRNPLAPICNALQIIRRAGGDGATAQAASEMMQRQVGQMVRLVDDLLDVSRISRGRIELRRAPVDLSEIVRHAVEAARPACESSGVALVVALPPRPLVLDADPVRLAQVIGNLLNNACKFSDKGNVIRLTVEGEHAQAVIRVQDNGIGIAAEHLPRIFDMFMQVGSSLERSNGGLGIGLTLVKSLVELHGGTVQASSGGISRGMEFVVRLPIMRAAGSPLQAQPAAEPTSAAARRILVVDDNLDAAESLSQLLQINGHETRLAHDGVAAVEQAALFQPHVVLLDIGLPRLNGYDAAQQIRQGVAGRSMLLVALTGWGQQEDRMKSRQAGFDEHFLKPVDLDVLLKLLDGLPLPGPAGASFPP